MMKISTLLFCCALCLSGTAAYYSIAGLATIFASAFWPVVAMATILEISKLVVASWLYQKWSTTPVLLKTYLTTAVVVLMFITSLGIFGFLSKAHVDAGLGNTEAALKIEQIDAETSQVKDKMSRYQSQLATMDRAINIQLDGKQATTAMANRKAQEAERTDIQHKLDDEQKKLEGLLKQKTDLRGEITLIESKVGPIKYIAEFFADGKDVDLDKAVRWMIVIIVMVFDPLAVLMLIAANLTLARENTARSDDAPSNTQSLPPQDKGPTLGQTFYDHVSGKTMWWNGATWKPIVDAEVAPVSNAHHDVNQSAPTPGSMPAVQADDRQVLPSIPIDAELIKAVVTQSMDQWLSKALSDPAADQKPQVESKNQDVPLVTKNDTVTIDKPETEPIEDPIRNKPTQNMTDALDTETDDNRIPGAEAHHVLDHFKPTHLTYSSRK